MKLLVTGCFGFIGSNLVSDLLNSGHEVIGFDNLSNPSIKPTDRIKAASGENWKNFKFYKVDIISGREMQTILMHEKPEAVIHLAAVGSVPRSFANPTLTTTVNETGFVTLLQTMGILGINRLVFASSSSVYGDNIKRIKCEGEEGRPLSPYALSKRMNEDFAHTWARRAQIKYVGLRFFNVYGPGQLVDSPYSAVIPRFINQETPTIFGDGLTERDFTFVGDVVEAIKASLDHTEKYNSNVYNVGFGFGVTLNELAEILDKDVMYEAERPGDIRMSVAYTDYAELGLGFRAKTPITEGLKITKEYYEGLRSA